MVRRVPALVSRRWIVPVVAGVLVVVAPGLLYLRSTGALTRQDSLDRVTIVLASRGEDGTQLASIVAVVTSEGTQVHVLDPLMEVTIAGTSYDRLRDAFPFGGAASVVAALAPGADGRDAWVEVPEETWTAALGQPGVRVTLPKAIDVFDGARLVSFPAGESEVAGTDVPLLLQGLVYLEADARLVVVEQVAAAVLPAVAALPAVAGTGRPDGVLSDLTPDAYLRLMRVLSER